MKRLLLIAALAISATAHADDAIIMDNGGMPAGYPASLMIAKVSLGSGTPSLGQSVGYDEAFPIGDGKYEVPGFLPDNPWTGRIDPRLVEVNCEQKSGSALWYCNGYHLDGVLERGEYIQIVPRFIKTVDPAIVQASPVPVPTPVPKKVLHWRKKKPSLVCGIGEKPVTK